MPNAASRNFGNHHLGAPTPNFAASPRARETINRDCPDDPSLNPCTGKAAFDAASRRTGETINRDAATPPFLNRCTIDATFEASHRDESPRDGNGPCSRRTVCQ